MELRGTRRGFGIARMEVQMQVRQWAGREVEGRCFRVEKSGGLELGLGFRLEYWWMELERSWVVWMCPQVKRSLIV